jgi:hypothetical protein
MEAHRTRRARPFILLILICSAAAGFAYAQLAIDRWSLHGGARSSGGPLRIDGTVGQPATGKSSGGALALGGGFWIPAEGPPAGVPSMEGLPERFTSFGCAPNPVRDGTVLTLDLPRATTVRVEAFSVDGARVAVLLDRPVSAGRLRVSWNVTGANGRRLPAGAYLLAVKAGVDRATERVIVLH